MNQFLNQEMHLKSREKNKNSVLEVSFFFSHKLRNPISICFNLLVSLIEHARL